MLDEEQCETLPPSDDRLHSGPMEKKVMTSKGIEWHARFVVLTANRLWTTKGPRDNDVIDYIPLYEIEQVYLEQVPGGAVAAESSKKEPDRSFKGGR